MSLRIDIVTLFPEIFFGPLNSSIVGRAREKKLVEINAINLRDFTHDRHQTVDDVPYGGGPGMLMKADVLSEAVLSLKRPDTMVILTGPRGERFNQKIARELAQESHLVILCGHYEGVDARIIEEIVDEEISIGDFVLTGGEIPACIIVDAVSRLVDGVLSDPECYEKESLSDGLLEYPQYTRPREFEGMEVPEVLLGGDHAKINKWRREQAILTTLDRRPEMLETAELTKKEKIWLDGVKAEREMQKSTGDN